MGVVVREQINENGNGNGYIKHSEVNDNLHFVERVRSIPIIHDSVTKAQDMANQSYLGRIALSTAQSVNAYGTSYLAPYYEHYLQPKVDALGCRSLDLIQKKYPALTKPTADLIATPTQLLADAQSQLVCNKHLTAIVDRLEQVVDRYLTPIKLGDEPNQLKRALGVLSTASTGLRQEMLEPITAWVSGLTESGGWHQQLEVILQNVTHQLDLVRLEWARTDLAYSEKLKSVTHLLQHQISPLIELFSHRALALLSLVSQKSHIDQDTAPEVDQKLKSQ